MRLSMVSESALAPGQGVHTAFLTLVDGLRRAGIDVHTNRLRHSDLCHAHTVGPLYWAARARTRPIVVSGHVTPESLDGSVRGYASWGPQAVGYLRLAYERADHVVAVSPYVRDRLRAIGVQTPITVIPNAVDLERFAPSGELREAFRRRLGYARDDLVVMAVGQLQPRKGVSTLLALAERLPDTRFLWVGGQPFGRLTDGGRALQDAVASAPPNVRLTGTVGLDEMPGYYNAADVFCLPSHQETFCLAAIEAASCGLPLVLRDLDVYASLFGDGYLGCSEDGFLPALTRLAGDEGYRGARRARALALAADYSLDGVVARFVDFYRRLLS